MERFSDTAIDIINSLHTERLDYNSEYIPLIDAANRLKEYEDTGLEPEEIIDRKVPEIDPVHYAGGCYCRECEDWSPYTDDVDGKRGRCRGRGRLKYEDDFCSCGIKREGDAIVKTISTSVYREGDQ